MKNIIKAIGISVVALAIIFVLSTGNLQKVQGEVGSRACTVTVHTAKVVGATSVQLLATSSLRAWATIQNIDNATNTITLALNGDAGAVAGNGFVLNGAVLNGATSTQSSLEFGLNTDLPYTGGVRALTDNGGATVFVSQCVY